VKYPDLIGGTNIFDSELIKFSNGILFTKSGADGVFCMGIRNERGISAKGITIKMESGNMKFLPMVVMQILEQLNILSK